MQRFAPAPPPFPWPPLLSVSHFFAPLTFIAMFVAAKNFFDTYSDNNSGWIVKASHVEHEMGYSRKSIRPAEDDNGVQEALMQARFQAKQINSQEITLKVADAAKIKRKKKKKKKKATKKPNVYVMKPNSILPVTQLRGILYSTMNCTDQLKLGVTHAQTYPYLMLQPRMACNNESKIILLGGKARFVSRTDGKSGLIHGKTTRAVPQAELFQFVEMAYNMLKENNPYFNGDSLVRIDVFQTSENKLVVNEVETLNANYSCANLDNELLIKSFLISFFEAQMKKFY